jgi:hypothetical protein
MADQATPQPPKKATHRSPNYPAFSLAVAITKVKAVYDADKRTPTTPEVIVGHLGYKHTDGPGGRALSCLRQYGLLEQAGSNWRVSDAAFNLLHLPESDPTRATLLREAARKPNLYRQLQDDYPDGLPSDAALKSNLLKRGFNPESLESVILDFRTTMALVKVADGLHNGAEDESKMENPPAIEQNQQKTPPPPKPPIIGQKAYEFAFAGEGKAELRILGAYSSEDLDDLDALLKTTLNGLRRSLKAAKAEPVQ